MGAEHGGIQSLNVDGADLLVAAHPGVLALEQIDPEIRPIPLKTRGDAKSLVSESPPDGAIAVRREIFLDRGRSNFLFDCRVSAQNTSEKAERVQLRLVAYRPLHIAHPGDRQFLYGSAVIGDKLEKLEARTGRPQQFSQMPRRITSQGKSHVLILSPREAEGMFHVEHSPTGETIGWIELPRAILDPGEEVSWNFQVYAGPMAMGVLAKAGVEDAIRFGAFSAVTKVLLRFLSWSNRWLHNYGLAICFLSIAVWLPFAPLTFYGMRMSNRTMQKMAVLKPQEARIRKEHKNNPQQAQRELMELYRKHGVNPASGCIGCLPFLFTWPIYIGLFQVLNRAPELRGAGFLWIHDLSSPDKLIRFPTEIPFLGDGLNILPVLATVATYFQQKAMQPAAATMTDEQKAQQQVMKFLPVMLLIFFYGLPSGFMLYWVVNSALMAGQQLLVRRSTAAS
ncbi:MAG: membrane protein insertase YidC [Candidatus Omnitrophica bacterium]|nr:membrane protein insertase YidC [Candidatus Omnitrophota bacterium]